MAVAAAFITSQVSIAARTTANGVVVNGGTLKMLTPSVASWTNSGTMQAVSGGTMDLLEASILDPAVTVRAAIRSAWFVAISDCSAESPVG